MSVPLVQLVDIPQRGDARGALSVAELGGALPFAVRRVYWIHSTKPGVSRGFHAHKQLRQLCVCVAGSVRLSLFDGRRKIAARVKSLLRLLRKTSVNGRTKTFR